ncbi:hypothetical protein CVT24_005823 [Panaeolus cyanescens]|uniref:FAD/NAD(P)-binding domain-containing protein n=1 Tax=Panaeolus cyanescens TaxID=181874 RepID=A0A409V912_9AGAR|nr:hypothetical protein CVT24_005823 [Panaeolus cyanescens]
MSAPISAPRDPRLTKPVHDERHVRIICIGAGASGLLFAYKLQRSFENFDLVLYEKNEAIAGTWHENVYPGCACDIPSHTYTWSFEPSKDWPSVYANSRDICNYFTTFASKHELSKYWKLNHEVRKAVWDDKAGRWDVEIANLKDGTTVHDHCHFLINGSGVLNNWKMPDITGFDKFKGVVLHTARWDNSVDLTDKHVGLIGNGSSAIQVLPAIAPKVKKVTTFIRTPTWVAPVQGLEQHVYTAEERKLFATDPEAFLAYRKRQETATSNLFGIFISGSEVQKAISEDMRARMKAALNNESLEWIVPNFGVGCRRLTPGVGYLETLGSDKVQVVKGGVVSLTENGCVCDNGQEYPVDILICATGFDTTFKPRFPIIGQGGIDLRDAWAKEPKSYFGVGAPHIPNYFTFLGPNSPVGNGPVLIAMEAQADYMLKFLNRYQTENIHSFVPKIEAVDDFIAIKNDFMSRSTWVESCKSWYKDVNNNVTALWPGSTLHYLEVMREPRYEDWEFKTKGNRYKFFGNGFSQTESDATADLAYYLTDRDDSPYLSRSKERKIFSKSGTVNRETLTTATLYNIEHPRLSKPIHDERFVKVICLGAGLSGLILAYKLRRSFENFELVIYEKNEEVGGTWFENTYPGVACDVPSHSYTYTFEPKVDWSAVYSSGKEIFDYFDKFADKYDLKQHIKFKHKVIGAAWADTDGQWNVEVERMADGTTVQDSCHILVNAGGIFNSWRWPEVPGLHTFKGPILHTANWDHNVDVTNKHVAIIGNGSSGVQVLPALLPTVSKITHFIRSPAWIAPALGPAQRPYTQEEIDQFKKDPDVHFEHRKAVGRDFAKLLSVYFPDSSEQKGAVEAFTNIIKEKIPDKDLQDFLIPKWGVGCRRISPAINYLEALTSDKVTIITGSINEITENGCVSEKGQEHPVDIIVCATGFDTSYKPRFPIIGLNGQRLDQVWKDEPNAYFGMAAAGFPNYFMMLGPGTPVNTGPSVVPFEVQADYILKMVDRWQTENIHSLAPKAEAVAELAAFRDNFMKGTVWTQNCRSWYKSPISGKVTAIWPGSALQYMEAIAEPRFEDFEFRYKENRFAFLGNGFSQVEKDPTAELLYCVRKEDDSPYLSRSKRRKVASGSKL